MSDFPVLQTARLILNQPVEQDLENLVYFLNQTAAFSENTLSMPFPYEEKDARKWFEMCREGFEAKTNYIFGIRLKDDLKLIGGIGLHIVPKHHKAELGFWLAKDYWNRGIVTEAAAEVMNFGFHTLGLNKIFAMFFPHNPASGKILEKLGMRKEGVLRQEILQNSEFFDLERYSACRSEKSL